MRESIGARLLCQIGTLGPEIAFGIFVGPRTAAAEQSPVHHWSMPRDELGEIPQRSRRDLME